MKLRHQSLVLMFVCSIGVTVFSNAPPAIAGPDKETVVLSHTEIVLPTPFTDVIFAVLPGHQWSLDVPRGFVTANQGFTVPKGTVPGPQSSRFDGSLAFTAPATATSAWEGPGRKSCTSSVIFVGFFKTIDATFHVGRDIGQQPCTHSVARVVHYDLGFSQNWRGHIDSA